MLSFSNWYLRLDPSGFCHCLLKNVSKLFRKKLYTFYTDETIPLASLMIIVHAFIVDEFPW